MAEFKVFISYSHAADGRLAPALQSGLQKFAKPWYRRRALRAFRDKTGLAVDESVWGSITRALDRSEYFLLLASRESAASKWVQREIGYWRERDTGRAPLIVFTDGELVWHDGKGDFDWSSTTAVPEALAGVYRDEPLWLDLRWARTREHLSLRHPQFREAIADLAATLHGVPKDEIAGRDVREHRRTLAVAWSAVVALLILTATALSAAYIAVQNQKRAFSRQLAAQAENVFPAEPALGLLLAVHAVDKADTFEARDALLTTLESQPQLRALLHGAEGVRKLAFSADGRTLATVGPNRVVTLWDLSADPIVPRPASANVAAEFDFDRESVAAGSRILERLETVGAHVRDHAISADGKVFATTDSESITLWDVHRGESLGPPLRAQRRYVRRLAFGPQGLLASASSAGTIAVWEVKRRTVIGRRLEAHLTSANSLAFSPDGLLLASGGYGGDVRLWRVESGEPLGKPLEGLSEGADALRFSRDGATLAGVGGSAVRWEVPTGKRIGEPVDVGSSVEAAFNSNLTTVALGDSLGGFRIVDLVTGSSRGPTRGDYGTTLHALAFSPDGEVLASGGNSRDIALWSAATGASFGPEMEAHTAPVSAIAFTTDGATLASYDSNGTLRLWDFEARTPVGRPLVRSDAYAGSSAMALSPDGLTAATSEDEGAVNLWDVASWRPLGGPLAGHPGDVVAMAFGPKGEWVASAGLGGIVILWDLRVDSWIARTCRKANRLLTPNERQIYLGIGPDDTYESPCERARSQRRRRAYGPRTRSGRSSELNVQSEDPRSSGVARDKCGYARLQDSSKRIRSWPRGAGACSSTQWPS